MPNTITPNGHCRHQHHQQQCDFNNKQTKMVDSKEFNKHPSSQINTSFVYYYFFSLETNKNNLQKKKKQIFNYKFMHIISIHRQLDFTPCGKCRFYRFFFCPFRHKIMIRPRLIFSKTRLVHCSYAKQFHVFFFAKLQ